MVEGNDRGLAGALSLGPPFAGRRSRPAASVMNPQAAASRRGRASSRSGPPAVAVREDFPERRRADRARRAAAQADRSANWRSGAPGLGDGLVAFQQGPLGNAAIVAAQATAPPAQFVLTSPKGWVKPSQALVYLAPATSADGPLTYHVVLDGPPSPPCPRARARCVWTRAGSAAAATRAAARDRHRRQSTLSPPATLLIDGGHADGEDRARATGHGA